MSHPHPELPIPSALAEGGVRIVALGGLGEVGRNMAVIEHGASCSSSTAACSSRTTTTPGWT